MVIGPRAKTFVLSRARAGRHSRSGQAAVPGRRTGTGAIYAGGHIVGAAALVVRSRSVRRESSRAKGVNTLDPHRTTRQATARPSPVARPHRATSQRRTSMRTVPRANRTCEPTYSNEWGVGAGIAATVLKRSTKRYAGLILLASPVVTRGAPGTGPRLDRHYRYQGSTAF